MHPARRPGASCAARAWAMMSRLHGPHGCNDVPVAAERWPACAQPAVLPKPSTPGGGTNGRRGSVQALVRGNAPTWGGHSCRRTAGFDAGGLASRCHELTSASSSVPRGADATCRTKRCCRAETRRGDGMHASGCHFRDSVTGVHETCFALWHFAGAVNLRMQRAAHPFSLGRSECMCHMCA